MNLSHLIVDFKDFDNKLKAVLETHSIFIKKGSFIEEGKNIHTIDNCNEKKCISLLKKNHNRIILFDVKSKPIEIKEITEITETTQG